VRSNPIHSILMWDSGADSETTEDGSCPSHSAVAGDLNEFTRLGSNVDVHDDAEQFPLIFRNSEVRPIDQSVWPGDFRVGVPPFIEVHREIGLTRALGGNQTEPTLGVHCSVIRQIYKHALILMLNSPSAEIAGSVGYVSIRVAERAQLDTLHNNVEAVGGELHVGVTNCDERFA
jgi:hypothetical protein